MRVPTKVLAWLCVVLGGFITLGALLCGTRGDSPKDAIVDSTFWALMLAAGVGTLMRKAWGWYLLLLVFASPGLVGLYGLGQLVCTWLALRLQHVTPVLPEDIVQTLLELGAYIGVSVFFLWLLSKDRPSRWRSGKPV